MSQPRTEWGNATAVKGENSSQLGFWDVHHCGGRPGLREGPQGKNLSHQLCGLSKMVAAYCPQPGIELYLQMWAPLLEGSGFQMSLGPREEWGKVLAWPQCHSNPTSRRRQIAIPLVLENAHYLKNRRKIKIHTFLTRILEKCDQPLPCLFWTPKHSPSPPAHSPAPHQQPCTPPLTTHTGLHRWSLRLEAGRWVDFPKRQFCMSSTFLYCLSDFYFFLSICFRLNLFYFF